MRLRPILFICALLAACDGGRGTADHRSTMADDPPPADEPRSLASYLHDLSPVLEGVTADNARLEQYRIPTREGSALDGWIRRPPGDSDQPLLLFFSPYYGGGNPDFPANALGDPSATLARFLIPRGYAVGFVSVGGTGNSGGCFRDGGPIERQQLYDAVQFLAEQPWSNGAVAAIGVSYDGTTANELFVDPPPALKTVIPIESITDYYRYSFNNGIMRENTPLFTTYYYPIVGLSPAGLNGGIGPSDPANFVQQLVGEACPEQLEIQRTSVETALTGDKSGHWQDRDAIALIRASLDRPRPSMFYIQGYQDANVDPHMTAGFLDAVAATGVPLHIWMGQWVHTWPQPASADCAPLAPCRGDFYELALLAWLDQFLKGRDTGILDAPAVQTQADDGFWRHADQWPPRTAVMTSYRPQPDGGLGRAPAEGEIAYTDRTGTRPEGLRNLPPAGDALLAPLDGAPVEFVSEPLAAALRLTGLPRLETVATADARRANLVATLLAENESGQRRYLNFAAMSLNHAEDLTAAHPDITGQAIPVAVEFAAQDNVIPAGWRLVLHIGADVPDNDLQQGNGSNFLNAGSSLLPIGVGAEIRLDLAATRLLLPVTPDERREPLSWLASEGD